MMHIKELTIYSENLESQIDFYTSVLGVKCPNRTNRQASFQLGSSVLTLVTSDKSTPYHFAINIPSNKEREALEWLKKRVEILKEEDIEIHEFQSWNARAIYFYDRDKNIVELISRRNLSKESQEQFSAQEFLSISEIGMPTNDIQTKFEQLQKLSGIGTFDGGFERFLAIGDESGLFICVNKKIKDWFPTGDKAYSSDFLLHFNEQGVDYHIEFKNDKLAEKVPV